MTTTINFPYTTDTNYTFDSDLIEVTGGVAKLKDQRISGATCGSSYASDINLGWGDGVLTGTGTGSPVITAGKLDLTGGTIKYVSYNANLNADSEQVGAIKFKLTLGYTGAPTSDQWFFAISKAHNDIKNLISIRHSHTSGYLRLHMNDSSGALIGEHTLSVWSPTSGVEYEFELNWDLTAGSTELYIDGARNGTTYTGTGTRDSSIGLLRIGNRYQGGLTVDFKVDDLVIYSTVQHTGASYTPGYTVPESKYSKDSPTITTNSTFLSNSLELISETSTITGSDNIKHTIVANSQDRYVTGGSAADSDGTYAQSSTATELDSDVTNIITTRRTVYLRSFLHSEYGGTTPELDLISIQYNAAAPDPTLPTLTELEGFIYDSNGPLSGESIQIRPHLNGFINNQIFHKYEWEDVATTDDDGFFFCNIYVQPSGNFWEFKVGSKRYKMALSDVHENYLWSLPTFEVIESE